MTVYLYNLVCIFTVSPFFSGIENQKKLDGNHKMLIDGLQTMLQISLSKVSLQRSSD